MLQRTSDFRVNPSALLRPQRALLFILGFLWPLESESFELPSLTTRCLRRSDEPQVHTQIIISPFSNAVDSRVTWAMEENTGYQWTQRFIDILYRDGTLCFYQVSVCNNPLLRTYVAQTQDQL